MRLSVGTNFDDELVKELSKTDAKSIYGKLPSDPFGGGRPTFSLPSITEDDLKRHIKLAHENNIKFNYVMNATCLDNMEYSKAMNKKLFETIDWLTGMGVDAITVSIPYLVQVIKKVSPKTAVSLSTFANVDSLQKLKKYEDLGVDYITLPENLNRDFDMLQKMAENTTCSLQVIATNLCLSSCPYRIYHSNMQSHASQSDHVSEGISFDYCMLNCTKNTLEEPAEIIKSPWIRPEDIKLYEEVGIQDFKITERMKTTERLAAISQAYTARKYTGDIGRLLNFRVKEDFIKPKKMPESDSYNMEYIYKSRDLLFKRSYQIDNAKLDGFLEFFKNKKSKCAETLCGVECRYCYDIAKKALIYDKDQNRKVVNEIKELLDDVASGALYKESEDDSLKWNEALIEKLEAFLSKKPSFIQKQARLLITKKAEELAKKDGRKEVSMKDLLVANYVNTPEDFQENLLQELSENAIDVADIEEV